MKINQEIRSAHLVYRFLAESARLIYKSEGEKKDPTQSNYTSSKLGSLTILSLSIRDNFLI